MRIGGFHCGVFFSVLTGPNYIPFSLPKHSDELQIGGIYIRIYNEQPTFPIHNCQAFVGELLEYLKRAYQHFVRRPQQPAGGPPPSAQHSHSTILQPIRAHNAPAGILQPTPAPSTSQLDSTLSEYQRAKARSTRFEAAAAAAAAGSGAGAAAAATSLDFADNPQAVEHVLLSLRALHAVIKANANVEIQCCGHFDWLFGFLAYGLAEGGENARAVKVLALDVVSLVSRNKDCVTEIGAAEILGQFLCTVRDPHLRDRQERVLETLSGLLNAQRLVKEAQQKGAVCYLLDLFVASRTPQIREQCAELLAKMTADKLTGPKVRISCGKFLPGVFLDAMVESPAGAVTMFESTQEHPELIWNERTRDRVAAAIAAAAERFHAAQRENAAGVVWRDSDQLAEIQAGGELVVSGVYLRLFVTNPGWTLRKPKQFLGDLLDFVADCISRPDVAAQQPADALETGASALVALLRAQPSLCDAVPTFGHIPKFFRQLTVQPAAALKVLHQLAASEVCVAAIAQTDCVAALKRCMEMNGQLSATVCETLSRLFKCQHVSDSSGLVYGVFIDVMEPWFCRTL